MIQPQLDLWGLEVGPVSAAHLREEERYGRMDALTMLGRVNRYSRQLSGARLAAYERGYMGVVGSRDG